MNKEYLKHITSTQEYQVWLHRTHSSNLEGILKKGLFFGSDLSSVATVQSKDINHAERSYKSSHKGNDVVIVIKIPNSISDKYYLETRQRHRGYEGDKEVTYWDDGGFYIQRKHIHGWIDKNSREYHPNHYLTEPQEFTDKHFPESIYRLEDENPILNLKNEKINQKESPQLPPPPKRIKI